VAVIAIDNPLMNGLSHDVSRHRPASTRRRPTLRRGHRGHRFDRLFSAVPISAIGTAAATAELVLTTTINVVEGRTARDRRHRWCAWAAALSSRSAAITAYRVRAKIALPEVKLGFAWAGGTQRCRG
jgi:hypothetical protein